MKRIARRRRRRSFQDNFGAQTRGDVLESAALTGDELVTEWLSARASEGMSQVACLRRTPIARRTKNPEVVAAAEVAGDLFESAGVRHAMSVGKKGQAYKPGLDVNVSCS